MRTLISNWYQDYTPLNLFNIFSITTSTRNTRELFTKSNKKTTLPRRSVEISFEFTIDIDTKHQIFHPKLKNERLGAP